MPSALRRPVVCLVTDRRRLPGPGLDGVVSLAGAAARAGVGLIQIREPDLEGRVLRDLACRILDATAGTGAAVVVNDRIDVAIAAHAHGVHLRADSVNADRVRGMAPAGFLIGQSVHAADQAVAAEQSGVDYIVMGTIYPTRSKAAETPLAGIDGVMETCRAVRVPVLAIGGVTLDRLPELADAGAAGIAAIGLFTDVLAGASGQDLEASLAHLVQRIAGVFAEC